MQLVKLPIAGQDAVSGTFTHSAKMVGDALLYTVVANAKAAPYLGATTLPDAGDNDPPGVEVQWPVIAGVTSTGRMVLVFRSGEQGPQGWTGRSCLYAALGAASPIRDAGQSVVVQTTQPGPAGPQGDRGDNGNDGRQGPPGQAGAAGVAGKDATVTPEEMDKLAALVVAKLFAEPPAADHFGLPPSAQSGTKFQDMQTIMLVNQGVWAAIIPAIDEAAANLLASGYSPKVKP